MVMGVPSALIGQAIGNVFYPRITEAAHRKENLSKLILKTTLVLAALGFLPFTAIVFFGPLIFSLIFGSSWTGAGEYTRWLSILLFFGFINRPSVVAIPVIGEQSWLLYYELFSTTTKLIALGIGFYFFKNDQIAIALFSISGVIAYIYLISSTILKVKKFENAKTS
jgi:O-antigen/teichoic acid export membrane protein